MDLQRYEHAKFELAEIIRSGLVTASKAVPRPEDRVGAEEPWRRLLQRLAEDRFTVVMAGRFSQGKSSLMNAVLGVDRLPTGLVPLTSVITSVRYGTSERVLLEYEGSAFRAETTLDRLAEYVTERGNPGNVKRIRAAEIQLPLELLRRGVCLVDTPGLGSAIVENSETTERFVPEIDVLILVTSYQSPMTEDELRLLTQARSVRGTFVVVNKQDTVPPETRAETLAYVERVVHRALGGQPMRAFSVSARDGLAAKASGDRALLAESGLADFETALLQFLTSDERVSLFLSAMCDRIIAHAHTLPPAAIDPMLNAVAALRERTGLTVGDDTAQSPTLEPTAPDGAALAPGVATQGHACDFCHVVADAQLRFLSRYQYAIATYPAARADHAERDGFCPLHTWHYEQVASPRGTSTGYPPLLERVASRLSGLASTLAQGEPLSTPLLVPRCPVCDVRRATEEQLLASILAPPPAAGDERTEQAGTFCVLHLGLVLSRLDDPERQRTLLVRHARILARLAEDLQRYAIRHDALRRDLVSKEEQDAPLRALRMLVGYKTVNAVFTVHNIL